MLDTDFPRPRGDVGNPDTWPFPVIFERVHGASARKIVSGDDADLIEAFVAAGERLAARGAAGLITSCGFLSARQSELAARLNVPIATSSLLQLPLLARALPRGRRVGVVTYDADALGAPHLCGVGADPATPIVGLPHDGAWRAMIEHGSGYRADILIAELQNAVRHLLATDPGVGAIVFECTNLSPFSAAIRETFGVPVFDIVTLGTWFHQGLAAR